MAAIAKDPSLEEIFYEYLVVEARKELLLALRVDWLVELALCINRHVLWN